MLYKSRADFEGRVAFALGTGRCGTHFLARVMEREPGVVASHERSQLGDAFHRYCQWYRLPVDHEGFLSTKEIGIRRDLAGQRLSFEASPYLSLSIRELYDRFGASFILLVRRPDEVVNSYWRKGWYERPYVRADSGRALGFQQCSRDNHSFARIVPSGMEFETWNEMSRVGKIAWFWNAINVAVLEQFAAIPETHRRVIRLEELSHPTYLTISEFLGVQSQVTEHDYERIAGWRPGRRPSGYTTTDWSAREIAEFEAQVRPAAERFDYEYRVRELLSAPHLEPQSDTRLRARPLRTAWRRLSESARIPNPGHEY